MWAEGYGREDAVLLLGHETLHTVLNLAPRPVEEHGSDGPERAHDDEPMLRASIVHWSHAGKACVQKRNQLIKLEPDGSAGGGLYWEQERDLLDVAVRTSLGKHERGKRSLPTCCSVQRRRMWRL